MEFIGNYVTLFRLTSVLVGATIAQNYPGYYPAGRSHIRNGEQKLLYHLLRFYEPSVRPVKNVSNAVVIKFGLTLTNIFDMDEKNQVLTTNVWVDQEWTDELLRWNPEDFDGIGSFRIPCDLLWLPDIVLYNNADDYSTKLMRSRAMVYNDGTVFWPPPTQLRSTCKIDVTYFPYDTQICILKFSSWTYHSLELDLVNRSLNIDLSNYAVSGEFQLENVYQHRIVKRYSCCVESYPQLIYVIVIRRKLLYYSVNVMFPCAMMSVLTLLVFRLPPESGEKMALGITVLLAFSVFMLAVAEKMPETSESVPLIVKYLTFVIFLSALSVVLTVVVLNLHHRGPFQRELPDWLRYLVLHKLRRILFMPKPLFSSDPNRQRNRSIRHRIAMKKKADELQAQLVEDLGLQAMTNAVAVASSILLRHAGLHVTNDTGDSAPRKKEKEKCKSESQDEIVKTLKLLISKQELDDHCEEIISEWKQVAEVLDRLLFWIFFLTTLITTVCLLFIVPMVGRGNEASLTGSDIEQIALLQSV